MDSHVETVPRFHFWSILKWTFAIPTVLIGVLALAIGVRYVVGKSRLDRLQVFRDESSLTIQFQPAGPEWLREWLGERCEPLERIIGIELLTANDDSLNRVLPNTLDAESVELWIDEDAPLGKAALSELAKLPKLKRLTINGDIAYLDLSWLPKCRQLEYLSVSIGNTGREEGLSAQNHGWSKLLTELPRLKELNVFDDMAVTREEILNLTSIPSLRNVGLNSAIPGESEVGSTTSWSISADSLQAEALAPLLAVPNLHSLSLECEELPSGVTDLLVQFPELRSLTVSRAVLSESNLHGIAKSPHLRSLTLDQASVSSPSALGRLVDCRSLDQLILSESDVGPDHLSGLAKITQLKSLRIDSLSESAQGLMQLQSLVNLQELDLRGEEASDDIFEAIASMPALHWLRFTSLPRATHPLQGKLAAGAMPVSLVASTEQIIREMQLQLRIDKNTPAEPTEYSIGERSLLPPDPQIMVGCWGCCVF